MDAVDLLQRLLNLHRDTRRIDGVMWSSRVAPGRRRRDSVSFKDAAAHRLAAADRRRHVDRPELRRQAALPAAREVRVQVLVAQFRDFYVSLCVIRGRGDGVVAGVCLLYQHAIAATHQSKRWFGRRVRT